jgi:hypothetical protein
LQPHKPHRRQKFLIADPITTTVLARGLKSAKPPCATSRRVIVVKMGRGSYAL